MKKRRRILPSNGRHHRPSPDDIARFLRFVEVADDGCWIWTGHCDAHGYGQFWYRGQAMAAHRVSLLIFRARLQRAKEVDHKCRNRSCVHPDHLRELSIERNRSDGGKATADDSNQEVPF